MKDKGRRGGLFYACCCGWGNLQGPAISMRRCLGDRELVTAGIVTLCVH